MDNRITQEEMIEMFGEEMPVEAARLFFEAPPEMTVAELRDKLRRLAKPDITDKMSDGDFLRWAGTDAQRWARGFLDTFPGGCVDEGTLIGWFANALMAGHDSHQSNNAVTDKMIRAGLDALDKKRDDIKHDIFAADSVAEIYRAMEAARGQV